ncbi:MAG TPA: helix-turn-helix domain-containing protein [Solirubrobacterales bacterium]|jgi:predicted ArsR family transcriptional regulator
MNRTISLTDPMALRAVAHPTRLKLIGLLRRRGPLTATKAAEAIGESPAGCSFHFRQLAKYGLVEEAGGGQGRERPWRATAMFTEWPVPGASAETDEASKMLARVVVERYFEEAVEWLERRPAEPREWAEAAILADNVLYLTAEELAELGARIAELAEPYVDRTEDASRRPQGSRPITLIRLGVPIPEQDADTEE